MGNLNQNKRQGQVKKMEYFQNIEAIPNEDKLKVKVSVHNPSEMQNWEHNLSKIKKIESKTIILPKQYNISESHICGSGSIVEIEYECYNNLLSQELNIRKSESKYLQQCELWYIAFVLSEAAFECHQFGQKLGDVKISNILMNREGNIRLLTQFSLPLDIDSYYRVQEHEMSFLSPEQMQSLKRLYMQNNNDYIKAESFSIGMTLLASAVLLNLLDLYDYKKMELNIKQLKVILESLKNLQFPSQRYQKTFCYSLQLKNVITQLLQLDPSKRLTSLQLYEALKPHEKQIMSLEQFEIGILRHQEKLTPKIKKDSSPLKGKHQEEKKEFITLKSKHSIKQTKSVTSSPFAHDKRDKEQKNDKSFANCAQALNDNKFIQGEGANFFDSKSMSPEELFKKIEAQLQKSRRQFPSKK